MSERLNPKLLSELKRTIKHEIKYFSNNPESYIAVNPNSPTLSERSFYNLHFMESASRENLKEDLGHAKEVILHTQLGPRILYPTNVSRGKK